MTSTEVRNNNASGMATAKNVDMKLEVVTIPVSDVDRAKEFYARLGWRLDADFSQADERAVQFTPPGSDCSVHFGRSVTPGPTEPATGLFLVVSDIQAAREELASRGVEVSDVFHFAASPAPFGGPVGGPAPDHGSYGSYAAFSDPDGNNWLLQEVTTRFPGRIDSAAAAFGSSSDLASALRRAAAAHGEHEKRTGAEDANWPDWYAEYMLREQTGEQLPT
jgi:catechol 2,3-dioxygenase-like lactoylglutathione lyase family enzyme